MRPILGVALATVLASAPLHAAAAPNGSFDFGSALFRGVFGETGDAAASRAALRGQHWGESPLRAAAIDRPLALTFAVPDSQGAATVGFTVAAPTPLLFARPIAWVLARPMPVRAAHFAIPAVMLPRVPLVTTSIAQIAPSAAYVAPNVRVSAQPGGTVAMDLHATTAFAASPSLVSTVVVPLSLHVGRLQLQGDIEGAGKAVQRPVQGLSDQGYDAGANFGVEAGGRRVAVNVSSSYERLMRDDTTAYAPAAPLDARAWPIGGDALPATLSYADMSKLAIGANVAVPVTHVLTLNLNYRAQRLTGGYGLPGLDNVDANDSWYGGNLTLAIPRWSSSVSLTAQQYHYQDNLLPANTFSDTRGNVNFTVKF